MIPWTRRSAKTNLLTLCAAALVGSTTWYAGQYQVDQHKEEPQPLPSIQATPLPTVIDPHVAPVTFQGELESDRKEYQEISGSSLQLWVQGQNGVSDEQRDTEIKRTTLNGDHYRRQFRVVIKDFLDGSAKGGRLELRSGRLRLQLLDVPTRDFVELETGQKVSDYALNVALTELLDQGERSIHAVWTPPSGWKPSNGVAKATYYNTPPLTVKIDTLGPVVRNTRLEGDLDKGPEIIVEFESGNLNPDTVAQGAGNFAVQRALEDGRFGAEQEIISSSIDSAAPNLVRLKFNKLEPGVYRVRVRGTRVPGDDTSNRPLMDRVGNFAGGSGMKGVDQERILGANPAPIPGARVEFPEFQPTLPQPQTTRRINAGDKVVTEVVRLYYYRDGHRVAQLINRTAESLNRAAVDLARRRAEDARRTADTATDERRRLEREAVREAEELRRLENQAAQTRQDLTAAQQNDTRLNSQLQQIESRIADFNAQHGDVRNDLTSRQSSHRQARLDHDAIRMNLAAKETELSSAEGQIASLQQQIQALPQGDSQAAQLNQQLAEQRSRREALLREIQELHNDELKKRRERDELASQIAELEGQVSQLARLETERDAITAARQNTATFIASQQNDVRRAEGNLASQRATAATSNENAIQAQAKEDRAREEQFRLEVAAAHEDPDTYAAAKLDSVDPVAQVSVQVIGEGLIQLRGPQKGIDTIRTAINQIDAPVGQVKVEVVTVQVNGERGDRMERPLGRIEAYIGLGRFLTAQSLMLLRQAIQEEAARIAMENDQGGNYQVDRDRKYLYAFFGRDFIDELYEMDSEFLRTENKLLGLHSMDTVSLHQALFIMALAKNEVRQQILANFMGKVRSDLVQAEVDYRSSSELHPFKTNRFFLSRDPHCTKQEHWYSAVAQNNQLRYHFRNLLTFFSAMDATGPDTMNPMQREFIRLAQIFKSRLITELELKQRIIERTMIEDDRERSLLEEETAEASIRKRVLHATSELRNLEFSAADGTAQAMNEIHQLLATIELRNQTAAAMVSELRDVQQLYGVAHSALQAGDAQTAGHNTRLLLSKVENAVNLLKAARSWPPLMAKSRNAYHEARQSFETAAKEVDSKIAQNNELRDYFVRLRLPMPRGLAELLDILRTDISNDREAVPRIFVPPLLEVIDSIVNEFDVPVREFSAAVAMDNEGFRTIRQLFEEFSRAADIRNFNWNLVTHSYRRLELALDGVAGDPGQSARLKASMANAYNDLQRVALARQRLDNARFFLQQTRSSLDRRKLLDFLIEEQQHKYIDLLEGTRAQIASMDNYLKRLSITLEDDFKLQFYDPQFVRIRSAAREWDVTLGAVERTSILTNNRAFAKVMPQATMEFDLPKRKIAVVEAFDGAKALVEDYGALLNDPTFLAAYKLMGGNIHNGKMQNVLPGLPSQGDEHQMGYSAPFQGPPGSSLESLIPDPSVYKFETGTGFEIRPVIQPDGHSIVYDFNYMYTTDVREPVRADEKHLGRIKRHFINTQVQTSSFEMREISRYQIALKAARTGQGVPLLQDIPIAGIAFRPLPSAESSIQQNIILASSVVYPTLFDLMGLRWAPSVVDLNHLGVRDAEHVVRGRRWSIENSVFEESSRYVDEMLGIPYMTPNRHRPDLYHRNWEPSPYHPGGFTYPDRRPDDDPTGEGFERPDRRPPEWREPPYDRRFRRPMRYEVIPGEEGIPGYMLESEMDAIESPEIVGPGDLLERNSRVRP